MLKNGGEKRFQINDDFVFDDFSYENEQQPLFIL